MTAREARVLRLGSAVILIALLIRATTAAVRSERASRRLLDGKIGLLREARAVVRSLPVLEQSSGRLRTALVALAPSLLTAATEADAFADLERRLTRIIERRGGRVESVEPVADSQAAGRARRVSVLTAFEADVTGAFSMLRTLASGEVILATDQVEIVAVDPFGGDSVPERLRVRLRVAAWYYASPR